MVKFASPSCVRFISFGFLLATTCVWVWMVCSLHSVTTGSRDRVNVPLIIIVMCYLKEGIILIKDKFWVAQVTVAVPIPTVGESRRKLPIVIRPLRHVLRSIYSILS